MKLFLSFTHIIVTVRVDELAPIERAVFKCADERLSGCDVGCERNVVHVAKAEKILLALVNLGGGVGASEIEHKVNFVI